MMDANDFQELLEQLIFEEPLYKQLQEYLGDFNIFEAIGMSGQEIRHSSFLAYLLNPKASHNLSDMFLKEFLIYLAKESDLKTTSAIQIDTSDFTNSTIETEEIIDKNRRIDIFIQNERYKLIVVIENKIFSGETGDQLKHYRDFVSKKYSDYECLFVFLTPTGDRPGDNKESEHYAIVDYTIITDLIGQTIKNHSNQGNQEQIILMRHYVDMLKRNGIIEDEEVAKYQKLWSKKYAKALDILRNIEIANNKSHYPEEIYEMAKQLKNSHHQASLKFLYDLKPNLRTEIKDFVKSLIESTTTFNFVDKNEKKYHLGLTLQEWKIKYSFNEETALNSSEEPLLSLSIGNYSDTVVFTGGVHIRERSLRTFLVKSIYEEKRNNPTAFHRAQQFVNKMYNTIFLHELVTKEELDANTILTTELKNKIQKRWETGLQEHLIPLNDILKSILQDEKWKILEAQWRESFKISSDTK